MPVCASAAIKARCTQVHGLAYQQVTYAQDLSAAAGKTAMEQLLSQDEKPDAVFAVSTPSPPGRCGLSPVGAGPQVLQYEDSDPF